MEIKLKNKKTVKIKDITIAEEAKLKDIMLKMVKPTENGTGVELIEPNYNCLLILQMVLEDPSDNNIRKYDDAARIDIALEVQKMLFEGNEKPSK
tara:strand:- start:3655 stop:3939 length:285 start_codon:yes stop_codon:yes gene_type:complete